MNKKHTSTVLKLIVFFLLPCCSVWAQPCRQQDSLSLVSLYNATNGANWTTKWDLSKPMTTWLGVGLNAEGCVEQLTLNNNNLTGTVPNLAIPNLLNVNLSSNKLTGAVPTFNCPKLVTFDLNTNQLSGNMPNFNYPNLITLSLFLNQVDGAIPDFNLPSLQNLYISYNQLTGSMPDFNMPNLLALHLEGNKLTGIIPNFTMPKLVILRVYDNQLSGTIPNFTMPKLEVFYGHSNNLIGSIPNFNMPFLKILGLDHNKLTGPIPNFYCPIMTDLLLLNNQLSGEIPNFNMPKLINLRLGVNKLTGSIPNFDLPSLETITLADNQLTGTIPNFNMPKLKSLRFYINQLSGGIPNFNMPNLVELDAYSNNLDGAIAPLNPNVVFTCQNNKLTFEDILPNVPPVLSKTYTPQDSVFKDTTVRGILRYSVVIDLGFDALIADNKYQWFKNGVPFRTVIGNNKLSFTNMQTTDAGVYTCQITNPRAPLLTLNSRKITLTTCFLTLSTRDSLPASIIVNQLQSMSCDTIIRWEIDTASCTQSVKAVRADNTNGCVMNGVLSAEIGNLKDVELISFYQLAGLKGTIPTTIGNLPKLKTIAFFGTSMRGTVPNTINNLSNLETFVIESNFDSLPDFSNLPKLKTLHIANNNFTFDDILPNMKALQRGIIFNYAPQKPFYTDTTLSVPFGNALTINLGIDGAIPSNIYKWFKNGVFLATTTVNRYTFQNVYPCDEGIYTAEVTNTSAPLLTLKSQKITVKIAGPTRVVPVKNQTAAICTGKTYTLLNKTVSTAGIYRDTVPSVICASVDSFYIVTDLKITPALQTTVNAAICKGKNYLLPNGTTVNTEGVYPVTIKSPEGCDSIVTTNLKFSPLVQTTVNAAICKGKSYILPNGNSVNTEGVYPVTIKSPDGCDSLITTDLKIAPTLQITVNKLICKGKNYVLPNGNTVNTEGVYSVTIKSPDGCDSLIITDLKIAPILQTAVNAAICQGKNYVLPDGSTVNKEGKYPVTIKSPDGCDSLITTDLKIAPTLQITVNKLICKGKNYVLPNGNSVNTEGVYAVTIKAPDGCDSIIITDLKFTIPLQSTVNAAICQGKNYILPNDSTVNKAGIYRVTIKSREGCDSLIITDVTFTAPLQTTVNKTICKGKNYVLPNGNTVNTEGVHPATIKTPDGCDSLILTDLKFSPTIKSTVNTAICRGKNHILPNGIAVNTEGTYPVTIKTNEGCDSLLTTLLAVNPTYTLSRSAVICKGDNYTLPNNRVVNAQGNYPVILRSKEGCDSTVTVNLTFIPSVEATNDRMSFTEDLKTLDIAITDNDIFPKNSNIKTDILTQPKYGNVKPTDKGHFEYELTRPRLRTDTFSYRLCYINCPNYCDTAFVFIDIQIKAPLSGLKGMGIIPNGNEANRRLSFPELDNPNLFPNNELVIINRWGQVVFKAKPYLNDWEGKNQHSQDLPAGTYYYILRLNINEGKIVKGDVTIVR